MSFKKILICSALLGAVISTSSMANQAPSWDFVDLSYVSQSEQTIDTEKLNLDGVELGVTQTIADSNFFYNANIGYQSDDFMGDTLKLTTAAFDIGYKHHFEQASDAFFSLGKVRHRVKVMDFSDTETATIAKLGVRSMLTNQVEFDGHIQYLHNSNISDTGFNVGVFYHINENAAVGVSYDSVDTDDTTRLTARWSF